MTPPLKATTDRPNRLSQIGDESRRRILDAAEQLFVERGVSDTSFASIERAAGISRGSIPWHFENKQGLLRAIVDRATLMTRFQPPRKKGRAGLREIVERAKSVVQRPQAVLLISLIAESIRQGAPTHDQYREWHRGFRDGIARLVTGSPEEMPLPKGVDPDTFAVIVFGALMGIHQQSRLAPELVDLEHCVAAFAKLLDQLFDAQPRKRGR